MSILKIQLFKENENGSVTTEKNINFKELDNEGFENLLKEVSNKLLEFYKQN